MRQKIKDRKKKATKAPEEFEDQLSKMESQHMHAYNKLAASIKEAYSAS